ncbi:ABC transporter ATP-binding protein [Paraconexibacter algicola]|uniref:ABC transporter ATP-binding protein n=1 Tax=Paraconexibacter algicola TaxID=2133960 RepID=A0A2T4UBT0_9ACTN|nr:ABC transporter ATP-binding protein [Paraconexibacter algicola]PTL54367.1 ABC transporter ATP-binding protein [Paraconexibacter algicola]
MTLIDAQGLTKRFGARIAVDAVDLAVRPGVCFGFLGPNGAGKTTMIRLLLGLARPDTGRVLIGGHDVAQRPSLALSSVGAIVEEPRFHPHLTGVENLRVHAPLVGDGAAARIPSLLERVGLHGRGDEKVKGYSMGMRQRLGVARALLGDPQLLVLDEPTNGLDAEGMAEFRTLIRSMVEEEGRTVFLSSHLLDEMQKLCDEVAIVEQGRIITQTTVRELLHGATGTRTLILDCDDPARATDLLGRVTGVTRVAPSAGPDGEPVLAVTCEGGRETAIAVSRALVEAGIGLAELRVDALSLERRYLDITREASGGGPA